MFSISRTAWVGKVPALQKLLSNLKPGTSSSALHALRYQTPLPKPVYNPKADEEKRRHEAAMRRRTAKPTFLEVATFIADYQESTESIWDTGGSIFLNQWWKIPLPNDDEGDARSSASSDDDDSSRLSVRRRKRRTAGVSQMVAGNGSWNCLCKHNAQFRIKITLCAAAA